MTGGLPVTSLPEVHQLHRCSKVTVFGDSSGGSTEVCTVEKYLVPQHLSAHFTLRTSHGRANGNITQWPAGRMPWNMSTFVPLPCLAGVSLSMP